MARLALKISGWIVLFYLGFLIVTLLFDRASGHAHQTISLYRDYPPSIYANTAHYAVYGMDKLDNYPRQVFILGASVSGRAFDPDILMRELPGYKVHNLSVSGSNIRQMEQVIDLLSARVDIRHLDSAVFVFGGHFASMLENDRRFGGPTTIENEELRHHLYYQSNGHVEPLLGGTAMRIATFAIKPFAALYRLQYIATRGVTPSTGDTADVVRRGRNETMDNASYYRAFRLKQFRNEGLTDEEFNLFRSLAARLASMGATVVYVDMPVPNYFRQGFSLYEDYRQREKVIVNDPHVHYFDMTAFASDEEFLDDAHPRPSYADRWSTALAHYLVPITARSHR